MEQLRTLQTLVGSLTHRGDRSAIVALHKEGRATWSYAKLAERSEQFARGLLGQGLAPGDRIAIVARNAGQSGHPAGVTPGRGDPDRV